MVTRLVTTEPSPMEIRVGSVVSNLTSLATNFGVPSNRTPRCRRYFMHALIYHFSLMTYFSPSIFFSMTSAIFLS